MSVLIGCVSTDVEPGQPIHGICLDESTRSMPIGAMVVMDVPLGVDLVTCGAIAIAPRLLLTSWTCVVSPADVERAVKADLTLDASLCTLPAGKPQEDGSLATRFAGLADPRSIDIYFPPEDIESFRPVTDIVVSGTSSGCVDNLALLVLDESLPVADVTLRLDDVTEAGEAVLVTDLDVVDGSFEPRATRAYIADGSDMRGPQRSLTLEHAACDIIWGGAVSSERTGALLGWLPPSIIGGCSDPKRLAVGPRLAPFSRMLLDAARDAEATTLRLEEPLERVSTPPPRCPDDLP